MNSHYFVKADIASVASYSHLKKIINDIDKEWDVEASRIFYMAVPPNFIKVIAVHLGKSGIARNSDKHRIVVEKPFGHDLESAKDLNALLQDIFSECQIFRIDHYLGKETVQISWQSVCQCAFSNLIGTVLTLNMSGSCTEKWSWKTGIIKTAGAVRDMVQNHILQLICLIGMEPPVNLNADSVRDKKLEVLHAIRKFTEENVYINAVRGQYGKGWIDGKEVKAYRDEKQVNRESQTETFAASGFLSTTGAGRVFRFSSEPGNGFMATLHTLPSSSGKCRIKFSLPA